MSLLWSAVAALLLLVDSSLQNKAKELHVACLVAGPCVLPCLVPSSSPLQRLLWSRQDALILSLSSDLQTQLAPDDPLAGRAGLSAPAVAKGNASLLVRNSAPGDRGRYRCSVRTEAGEQHQDVIVKVQAPIRSLSVELSRLSGFEEIKCSVQNVFPPPRVTWSTEPPTLSDLRPLTRKKLEPSGLYEVDSRLRPLEQKDLVYICTASSSYGGESWSASYRHRDVRGNAGKDLTLPCFAPSYLNSRTLSWTFANSDAPKHILTYSVQSGKAESAREWVGHVELDGFRVQFGDGSLRLMDPDEERHAGRYTCVFSTERKSHTERLEVNINNTEKSSSTEETSYWWILGLVAILVIALVAMVIYLKLRGRATKPKSDPEDATELHPVKDSPGATNT
ncbi:hemicentin-2-like [Eucyclogobius newberryi]|uniref:hemicentin-2-like n=1 Tax=Eucyclogobius newberryi TaxID=166745 RepID=UPI003B5BF057